MFTYSRPARTMWCIHISLECFEPPTCRQVGREHIRKLLHAKATLVLSFSEMLLEVEVILNIVLHLNLHFSCTTLKVQGRRLR